MAEIKFGTQQITNPTPANVNLYVRVFTISTAIFLGWMSTANIMGPNTKDILTQILGLALALSNGLAPLFGVKLSSEQVPLDEVTAVDTTKLDVD